MGDKGAAAEGAKLDEQPKGLLGRIWVSGGASACLRPPPAGLQVGQPRPADCLPQHGDLHITSALV